MAFIADLPIELLHEILLYLPPRHLLLAQRVSHQWRQVINESPAIQQALYLSPREPEVYWKYTLFHTNSQNSPQGVHARSALSLDFYDLCADAPLHFTQKRETFTRMSIGREPFTSAQVTAAMYGDPVVDDRDCMQRRCILGEHNPMLLTLDSNFSIWTVMKETGSSFLRFSNRCANILYCPAMFLTQPPARRLTYTWRFDRSAQDYLWSSGEITNDSGLIMADVLNEIMGLESALKRKISWAASYIVIDGPLCPSSEQEREYERDMDSNSV